MFFYLYGQQGKKWKLCKFARNPLAFLKDTRYNSISGESWLILP